jgi:hypothetical protein
LASKYNGKLRARSLPAKIAEKPLESSPWRAHRSRFVADWQQRRPWSVLRSTSRLLPLTYNLCTRRDAKKKPGCEPGLVAPVVVGLSLLSLECNDLLSHQPSVDPNPMHMSKSESRVMTRLRICGRRPRIGIKRLSFGNWLKAPTLRVPRRAELLKA